MVAAVGRPGRRRLALLIVALLLLLSPGGVECGRKKKKKAVPKGRAAEKVKAKSEARSRFEKMYPIVFDGYGRVLQWAREAKDMECEEVAGIIKCTVTKWETRKYRTKEEDRRQKMIRLDKQAEMDNFAGQDSESARKQRRHRKENRLRCGVFRSWLEQYERDASPGRKTFWTFLEGNYEDFGNLVRMAKQGGGGRAVRKAKKLYRHIALNTHTDKLPEFCNDENMKSMMQDLMGQTEKMKECVIEPHTCNADEL